MNVIVLVLLIFLALILIGLVFKLAKFFLKLASLVLLFVLIIWIGFFVYNVADSIEDTDSMALYVVEFNESYTAYDLRGAEYDFFNLSDEDAVEVLETYDSVYLISYETLKQNCVSNATIRSCISKSSLDHFWKKVNESE